MFTNTIAQALGWKQLVIVIHLFILMVPVATEKVSRIRSNIIWNRWKTPEGKIDMSEPESEKGNVNTVYFVNQACGYTRISLTAEFVYDE